jgi:hypothetical protein
MPERVLSIGRWCGGGGTATVESHRSRIEGRLMKEVVCEDEELVGWWRGREDEDDDADKAIETTLIVGKAASCRQRVDRW